MRSENEQIHYRAKFRLSPYTTTTPSIVDAYRQIYAWVRDKEQRKRHEQSAFEFCRAIKTLPPILYLETSAIPLAILESMTTGSRVVFALAQPLMTSEAGFPSPGPLNMTSPTVTIRFVTGTPVLVSRPLRTTHVWSISKSPMRPCPIMWAGHCQNRTSIFPASQRFCFRFPIIRHALEKQSSTHRARA